ncbi:unnamed protein product [Calicophoron daubneyi]|uniref:Dynein regulatory complex protein 1 n=1 Tax=Calicophoron daubneyi TaxID=300641 RepID=A0AAV2TUA9_CALDB
MSMNSYTRKIYFKQEEVADSGPSVNSEDIEQRLAARKLRIENRIKLRQTENEPQEEEVKEELTISQKQIELSTQRISKLVRDGDSFITNIRVACDARENLRRTEEDELNAKRVEKLEEDANVGYETFNKISDAWSDVRATEVPQETREKLHAQKTACTELVGEKNKLINELNLELKAKDDHYVRELKKRTEDIDLLAERMESQIQVMQKTYREELKAIEDALVAQKDKLLAEQNAEWEALMHEVKQKQINYLNQHFIRIEEFEKELKDLRIRHSEEYNALKNSLETEVETLETQLLKLKATYQLNLEKLEYNFQVLKRRDEENMITKSNQKRKITRMQDALNQLHNKAMRQERQYSAENEQLSEDYKKRMENFRDLQKKSKLLIEGEHRNFREIWIMNEENLKKLINRLLEANRVINEQQLGLPWNRPDVTFMCNVGPLTGPLEQITCKPPAVIAMQRALRDDHDRSRRLRRRRANEPPKSLRDVSPEVVRDFLELLCYEPEFLIEEKLKRLLKPLTHEEETLMRLDTILTAVGVQNEEDLDALFRQFITKLEPAGPTQDKQTKTTRPLRLVAAQGPTHSDETSVDGEAPPMDGTQKQGTDGPKTENVQDSQLTTNDDAIITKTPSTADEDKPLLHSELLGPVKKISLGGRGTTEFGAELFDPSRHSGWGQPSEGFRDPDRKHTDVSDMTEISLNPIDEDAVVQKTWTLIAPVNVVSALHQFSLSMQRREERRGQRYASPTRPRPNTTTEADPAKKSSSEAAADTKSSASASAALHTHASAGVEADKRDDSHDAEYWDKYANHVVTPDTEKVWDNLYAALERYLVILKHRAKLIRESEALRRQNGELRHLLQQYLGAKINYDLVVPPADTMKLLPLK